MPDPRTLTPDERDVLGMALAYFHTHALKLGARKVMNAETFQAVAQVAAELGVLVRTGGAVTIVPKALPAGSEAP